MDKIISKTTVDIRLRSQCCHLANTTKERWVMSD